MLRRAKAADQRAIGSGRFFDPASLLKCAGLIEDRRGRSLDQPRLGCGAKARSDVIINRDRLFDTPQRRKGMRFRGRGRCRSTERA